MTKYFSDSTKKLFIKVFNEFKWQKICAFQHLLSLEVLESTNFPTALKRFENPVLRTFDFKENFYNSGQNTQNHPTLHAYMGYSTLVLQ